MPSQVVLRSVQATVFVATTSPNPVPSPIQSRQVVSTSYQLNISANITSSIDAIKEIIRSCMQESHGIQLNLSEFRAISSPTASGLTPRNWQVLSDCPPTALGSYSLHFYITRLA